MDFAPVHTYIIDSIIAALIVLTIGYVASRGRSRVPGRLQAAFEIAIEGLQNLFMSSMGPGSQKHLWLVIPLFFYIWICNFIGQIPGLYSPTGNLAQPLALALIVFVYVQIVGIRSKGLWGYLRHFAGPVLAMAVIFVPIEIIGELAKPFSLSMRLFGNISAEDIINNLAANAGKHWWLAAFQTPVYFLQIFTDTIQAFIFPLLACAYIAVMSSHHDDKGDEFDHGSHNNSKEEQSVDAATGWSGRISTVHSDIHDNRKAGAV